MQKTRKWNHNQYQKNRRVTPQGLSWTIEQYFLAIVSHSLNVESFGGIEGEIL